MSLTKLFPDRSDYNGLMKSMIVSVILKEKIHFNQE